MYCIIRGNRVEVDNSIARKYEMHKERVVSVCFKPDKIGGGVTTKMELTPTNMLGQYPVVD